MAFERVPTDVVGDDLVRTYNAAIVRLEAIIRAGLERGLDPERLGTGEQMRGDATAAYRARQLRAARSVLAELERAGPAAAPVIAARAYRSALFAVDSVTLDRRAAVAARFGGIHQRAVNVLASNMAGSLEAAAQHAGASVDAVFARADALEAGIPPGGFPFVGRRVNDPWRRVALDTLGQGVVTLDTRKQISAALARNLVTQGVADALTGYVDRGGRRWALGRYAAMVTRTTTREATSRAAANRMAEHGLDLVTVSSHGGACEICADYDGQTFSMSGQSNDYPPLDELPPWHPNCVHVITPAGANLDDYEAALEEAVGLRAPSPAADEAAGAAPPFGARAVPSTGGARSLEALEAQRVREAIEADPGADPEAELARDRAHDQQARLAKRGEDKYLADALGPDLAHYVGLKWGREAGIREDFLAGKLTTDDVEQMAYEQSRLEDGRRDLTAMREQEAGFRTGSIPCFSCGHFKPRPSAVCGHCGDDPVTYGGSAHDFDRAYGYSSGYSEANLPKHERRLGG